ncbi:hypothetical protein AAE02nite_19140 [Adhaeribacter aerolatus]|uniref:Uncharacterized protein n=1 Tax=Adhaeribacter aerolatus TaxID=670289 RepID=A0A512AX43_9BACT|nr:hypothetical protein [Adhaeribacter aerolatus]GEO04250.1 hypothetical protein AAE02nite_19140 [Adhaeribacter aerolatus]
MAHWTFENYLKIVLLIVGPLVLMAHVYQSQRVYKTELLRNNSIKAWIIKNGSGYLIGVGSLIIPLIVLGLSDYLYYNLLGDKVKTEELNIVYKNQSLATNSFLILSIPSLILFALKYDKTDRGTHNRNLLIVIVIVCFFINLYSLSITTPFLYWLD